MGEVSYKLLSMDRGIRVLKISAVGLSATFLFQAAVAWMGGSAALLADALHNFADAFTSLPLWVAFLLSKKAADKRFRYGYHRAEDLAGIIIVLVILGSGLLAAYESVQKWFHQTAPTHLRLGMVAALVGLVGNELVAVYKIREGKAIGSTALVADGLHSRVDGLTSLAAFLGLLGVYWGFSWADPVMGLIVSIAIFYVAWESGRGLLLHLMDAVEPEIVEKVVKVAGSINGVRRISQVRGHWSGRWIFLSLCIQVDPEWKVVDGHRIAEEVRHNLLHHIPHVADVDVHVDPAWEGLDPYHELTQHHFQTEVRS